MYDGYKRRISDFDEMEDNRHQAEIEQLIAEEEDPRKRLHLIVLNRINLSLVANTNTVRSVSEKLEEHLENFEKRTREQDELVNKSKGAWKVMIYVLGFLQVVGIGLWTTVSDDLKFLHKSVAEISTEQARRAERIRFIEDHIQRYKK